MYVRTEVHHKLTKIPASQNTIGYLDELLKGYTVKTINLAKLEP